MLGWIREKKREWSEDQRATWAAHGIITAAVPAVITAAFGWPAYAYVILVALTALFYQWREGHDWVLHEAKGDLDTPNYQGITPRMDKAGDLIGPYSVLMGAMVTYILTAIFG